MKVFFKGEIAKARDLVLSIEPGSGATQGRLCPSLCFSYVKYVVGNFFTAGRTGVVMGKIHSRGTRDGGFIIDLLPCECEAFVVLFLKRCHT
jgi:hypothetical protein